MHEGILEFLSDLKWYKIVCHYFLFYVLMALSSKSDYMGSKGWVVVEY
jgi:hypothetical protein